MSFAVNTGLIDANPLTKISAAFPSPGKSNLPAIKSDELPDLLAEMRGVEADPIIHASLDWLMLTMTRPSEAIEARWDEINLEDRVWVIPAERMKMRREHIVPLSEQAIKVLSTIKIYSGGEGFYFHLRSMSGSLSQEVR
jgi:integrase